MPRPTTKSSGFVYQLSSPACDDIYIGSTVDFKSRIITHKTRSQPNSTYTASSRLYDKIRETGGWVMWNMEVVEEVDFTEVDKPGEALKLREKHYIQTMRPSLNIHVPLQTSQEWKKSEAGIAARERERIAMKLKLEDEEARVAYNARKTAEYKARAETKSQEEKDAINEARRLKADSEEHKAKAKVWNAKKYEKRVSTETPEEREIRLAKTRVIAAKYAEANREKINEAKRKRWAESNGDAAVKLRESRQRQISNMSPEEIAERRGADAERSRAYLAKKKAELTPEEIAEAKAIKAEKQRARYAKQLGIIKTE